jgi:hypothetical protein
VVNTKETTQGGAAIFQEGGSLTVINCTFTDNPAGTLDSATNCQKQHGGAGPNLQYPSGGGAQCTGTVTVADPLLGVLQDNGGPTKTIAVASGSPAIGQGTNCPATDQRGHARAGACTLGAYEAD